MLGRALGSHYRPDDYHPGKHTMKRVERTQRPLGHVLEHNTCSIIIKITGFSGPLMLNLRIIIGTKIINFICNKM